MPDPPQEANILGRAAGNAAKPDKPCTILGKRRAVGAKRRVSR
jgi:hypothetical protein